MTPKDRRPVTPEGKRALRRFLRSKRQVGLPNGPPYACPDQITPHRCRVMCCGNSRLVRVIWGR